MVIVVAVAVVVWLLTSEKDRNGRKRVARRMPITIVRRFIGKFLPAHNARSELGTAKKRNISYPFPHRVT